MKSRHSLCALLIAALLVLTCASAAGAAPAGTSQPSASPIGYTYYTVQPGDNLYRISLRYGISVYTLMRANGLTNPNHIYVGQVLRIPSGQAWPSPAPPSTGFYYTVARGDTLALIAARFGSSAYAIMQANGLSNPNYIYASQVLWIPGAYRPPQPTAGYWRGEYYNNERLTGAPSVIRYDPAINFDWGVGWPHPKIGADRFSVRWTRSLRLDAGTWRFATTTDDGVRLYVDDVLVIDQWHQQPARTYTADVSLGMGYHTIRMEYFELTGTASAHLKWEVVSCPGPTPTACGTCPTTTPTSDSGAPTGIWLGQYYDNMFLDGNPEITRFDASVDFEWGNAPPGPGMPKDLWSAHWTRTLSFDAGTYRFHAIVDDGVRIFVDGQVVIDKWDDNPGVEFIGDTALEAGDHTIKVEYFEKAYDATIHVWWEKLP